MPSLQDARSLWVTENPHPIRVEENGVTREIGAAEYQLRADEHASARLSELLLDERRQVIEAKRLAAVERRADLSNPNASAQARSVAAAAALDYILARDGL